MPIISANTSDVTFKYKVIVRSDSYLHLDFLHDARLELKEASHVKVE